ncbi:MAG: NAD-dependent epimerase/dehydratase family protein [Candidatus Binatia bacterium]
MKILVTGGTGFTGGAVARRFLERGHSVRVLDTKEGLVSGELQRLGGEVLLGSITDRDAVRRAMAGVDVVLHVAAAFREVVAARELYWSVNVEGTRVVAEAALAAGVSRFVYCSTEGVHGHVRRPPGDEDGPIEPADVYQETKWHGELLVREHAARGLPAVVVRPTGIYGPGDPGRFLLLFRMVRRGRFFIVGDGTSTYHPVYIENLVDGFELAVERPDALGGGCS